MEIALIIVLIALIIDLVLSIGLFAYQECHANDIRLEASMKPCPKCGHRAVTVYYNGENDPPFFTAECGAYARRNEYGHINGSLTPAHYFDNDPPMTEAQKRCSYCAGYTAKVPHFVTRRGAVRWWNNVACKQGEKQ